MATFKDFKLNAQLLQAIDKLGFVTPSEIQEKAIPFLINNKRDLIGLAQTGTGKTAAFGLPLLQNLDTSQKEVQIIILCPTRELCLQLSKDLKKYADFMPKVSIVEVYGGTDIQGQIRKLNKGAHIVVGTAGRTLDLIKRRKLKLGHIKYVVFDEADEMLSMGFRDDMDAILEVTPKEKNTLLFSATMPKEIASLVHEYMENPHEITIGSKNTGNSNVQHSYYEIAGRKKYEGLKRIADAHPNIYAIVFCRTRAETKDVAARLGQDGYNVDALHGDLSQSQRDIVMERFRAKQLNILIATDVAARGIDVDDLTHVINFNIPDDLSVYTHRSGRTGRAGNSGESIIFASSRDKRKLREIEQKIMLPVERKEIPAGEEVVSARVRHRLAMFEKKEISTKMPAKLHSDIHAQLDKFSKAEIIDKFIASEFNDVFEYYDDAQDLNVGNEKRKKNKKGGGFTRFYINMGTKHKISPKTLLNIINSNTPNDSIDIGSIEIMKGFSFFEVSASQAQKVEKALAKKSHKGIPIVVRPVSAKDKPKGKSRKNSRFDHKGKGKGKFSKNKKARRF